MSTHQKPISIADAISPLSVEPVAEVEAWHLETIRQRREAADQGHFASTAEVQAIMRKFVPDE
jgi:predicted transcriptional regulator